MEKTTQTNKYYLYFEAYFSNWNIARFTEKNIFILLNPYKQTKNNLFYFSGFNKKSSVCSCNDIETIKSDFKKKIFNYNMKLFQVDKNTYFEALELLKNHDETKEKDLKLFKDFYNRIENNFENILK